MGKHAKLSPKDIEILNCIVMFKSKHDGNSPSIREIGDACGINSTSVVRYHMDRLERFGMIERAGSGHEPRMIRVIGGCWLPPGQIVTTKAKPQPAVHDQLYELAISR